MQKLTWRILSSSLFLAAILVAAAAGFTLIATAPAALAKQIDWDDKLAKERHLMATNSVEEAMKILDDYLKKHPESGALHCDMGKCLRKRGHDGEAKSEFKRATEVEPEYADAWYELGAVQQSGKEFDQAADSFEHYLQTAPYSDKKDAVKDRINFCKSQG